MLCHLLQKKSRSSAEFLKPSQAKPSQGGGGWERDRPLLLFGCHLFLLSVSLCIFGIVGKRGLGLTALIIDHCKLALKFRWALTAPGEPIRICCLSENMKFQT
ncbi:hypothetical protein TorRG33x02_353520 [Trema orientale]|uniref:Uncharacterized protein n=1 Tax=Trema orientale TaxID=63057 RepID=A0A2P5ACU8_TREOI|nr:hypothetical protein TorRG33x02_353520 [Trema orientale]